MQARFVMLFGNMGPYLGTYFFLPPYALLYDASTKTDVTQIQSLVRRLFPHNTTVGRLLLGPELTRNLPNRISIFFF